MADYSKDFCDFWTLYGAPRNASKADSWRAWNQKIKSRPSQELMLASVQSYNIWLAEEQSKGKNGFPAKCHPATWIRGERWDGFLDSAEAILRAKDGHSQADRSASAKSWNGWRSTLEKAEIGDGDITHWFLPATLIYKVVSDIVEIRCPSQFHASELEKRFGQVIRKAFGPKTKITVAGKN